MKWRGKATEMNNFPAILIIALAFAMGMLVGASIQAHGEIYDPLHCKYADMQMCYLISVGSESPYTEDKKEWFDDDGELNTTKSDEVTKEFVDCFVAGGNYNFTSETCHIKGEAA